jgi:hypothetical protein
VSFGLERVAGRCEADVFVVDDGTKPGERVLWNAALNGGLVLEAKTLLGNQGLALKYKAATLSPKRVWLSPTFKQHHPTITQIVVAAAMQNRSRWKVVEEKITQVARSKPKCYYANVIVPGEAGIKLTTKSSFLVACTTLDKERSGFVKLGGAVL